MVPFGGRSHSAISIRNYLHAPGFGIVALCLLWICRRSIGGLGAYLTAFVLTMLIGVAAESAQLAISRQASVQDLLRDAAGAIGFLSAFAVVDRNTWPARKPGVLALLTIVAIAGVSLTIAPLAWHLYALKKHETSAPVIADFENRWQDEFRVATGGALTERVTVPANWPPTTGSTLLKATIGTSTYSGIRFVPFQDWSGYSSLRFSAASGDDRQLRVTVRVSDRGHNNLYADRYNKVYYIDDTAREYSIALSKVIEAPKGRKMKMREITSLVFFLVEPDGTEILLLDDVRLE